MNNLFDVLMAVLVVHLFFSFGINAFVYSLPADDRQALTIYESNPAYMKSSDVYQKFNQSISSQTNFSILNVTALALYSGNIMADLLTNFIFAVPAMSTILLEVVFSLVSVPIATQNGIKILFSVIIFATIIMGLLRFLTSSRTTSTVGA